jgi:hypothetical protein
VTLTPPRTADSFLMIDNVEPVYSNDAGQVSGQRKKEVALRTSDK